MFKKFLTPTIHPLRGLYSKGIAVVVTLPCPSDHFPGQNPDIDNDDPKNFYESDSKDSPAGNGEAAESTPPPPRVAMDPDHRLLLRTCKPLLQSRNNAVVMAVAQLYYYLAPRAEVALCVRALVRLLRSHREGTL